MKTTTANKLGITVAAVLALIVLPAHADTFGTGANQFTIDFVEIGNPGNANDRPFDDTFPDYSSPYGGVGYAYRMGTYEISQDAITKATASGLVNVTAGAWGAGQPATNMTWFEAAAFVNWLNTSTGHHAAYQINAEVTALTLWSSEEAWQHDGENLYRHKDAYYFLPSEDEWYKAAYHKNDGVTANYWDYATGSNNIPDGIDFSGDPTFDAVFNQGFNQGSPNAVTNVGVLSPYGTFGQTGNAYEWEESAHDGSNNSSSEHRAARGGDWHDYEAALNSSYRGGAGTPGISTNLTGFRVASVSDADTDGDGIPDRFETGTGIYVSPQDTGSSATNPDTDGDGFNDGFEVTTGFNPTSALSTPETHSTILPAVALLNSAEYRFNAALGISYRIEASTDLANWMTIETNIIGAGGAITRFYSIEGQPKRFFRSRRN